MAEQHPTETPATTSRTPAGQIEPWLLDILRSPGGEHRLVPAEGPNGPELRCEALGVAYPVVDGIPVLLADEARPL